MNATKRIAWSLLLSVILSHGAVARAAGVPDELPDPDGKPADMSKPVKVFILLGQSNMLGFGNISGGDGSLEHAAKEKGLYPYLVDEEGNWTVRKDVRNVRVMVGKGGMQVFNNEWMTATGKSIGPELGIGHYVGYVLDEPVLILKSCIGNRSLGWDLLPPGSEPYEFNGKTEPGYRGTPDNPQGNGEKPVGAGWYAGKQYDDDIENAKKVLADLDKYYPGAKGYEVEGFFWWQGDKDMRNPAHVSRYEQNLEQLMAALRKDFDAPNAKFVFATLGQTKKGSKSGDGKILDAMFAVSEKNKGSVEAVYTNPLSKGGSSSGHYNKHAETYMNVGEGMGKAMAEMLLAGGASGGGGRSIISQPVANTAFAQRRAARQLAPGQLDVLNRAVLNTLVQLSDAGGLSPVPLSLSFTRAQVALSSVAADYALTFRSASGQEAKIAPEKLKPTDFAALALLAAQFKPESSDVQALAGVYLECLGRVEQADEKFAAAGPESTAKMVKCFK